MMPWSGLLPINVKHAYEMGTSELHLNQHHVGSHRADHGPKHAPGMISDDGGDNRKTAEKHNTVKTAIMRTDAPVEKRLTGTSPLPKSGPYTVGYIRGRRTSCAKAIPARLSSAGSS
jgi:hypothetical protein